MYLFGVTMGKTYKDMRKNLRKTANHLAKHEKTPFMESVKDLAYGGMVGVKTN